MKKILLFLTVCICLAACAPRYNNPLIKAWTPKDHSKDSFKNPRKHQRR